jgi:hypothetical protein
MVTIDPKYMALAFREGVHDNAQLGRRELGKLRLGSGHLAACDPFVFPETPAFARALPPGEYPVVLTIARLGADERVAFATLELAPDPIESWEMMLLPGQDGGTLGEDEYFGYPVDAGTGCLADKTALEELVALMDASDEYGELILEEMNKTYSHTWSWVDWRLPSGANVVAFSSGWGDGAYPSYVALSGSGCVFRPS